ncbi:uncharacterized protein [Pyrus communis]|uniref:uncharacterized protein n=1 Tax=Pyrus communis TaxID=23211 RepID=UPI0035C0350E
MKGREAKGALSADLLVCFPSRTNLKLMPKPICSPARPSEPNNRHHHHPHHHQQLVKKTSIGKSGLGHASPLLWTKTKHADSENSEPTSPKVTCAGQIKVRHRSGSCKSWQTVMEEIERIHNKKQRKQKRPNWAEALGFKKEVMQFLTCLRSIRFDFRCFGSFPHESGITSEDEEDEEEEEENRDRRENHVGGEGISDGGDQSSSSTVFSKWFMILQENQSNGFCKEDKKKRNCTPNFDDDVGIGSTSEAPAAAVPPPNALLLMRCRSAPAKTWLEEKEDKDEEEEEDDDEDEEKEGENGMEKEEKKAKVTLRSLMEEDKQNKKLENLVAMAYDSDFYNISSDIAKETWVVGGLKEAISRSRSWKR